MTLAGADDVVGLERRRLRPRGGGDYEGADQIRAEIRAGGWSRATVRGGTELIPVAGTTRPIRR